MKTEKNRRLSLRNEKTVTVWITIERVHENKTKKEKKSMKQKNTSFAVSRFSDFLTYASHNLAPSFTSNGCLGIGLPLESTKLNGTKSRRYCNKKETHELRSSD